MDTEVVKATKASRLKFFIGWLSSFAVLALAAFFERWLHQRFGSTLPLAVGSSLFAAYCLAAFGCAAYFVLVGRKILRLGQFPLPNAWLLRDTPVLRGTPAKVRAYLLIISGALVMLGSAALFVFFGAHLVLGSMVS